MMTPSEADEAGHARYTYRLRVSSTARGALLAEWDRCRWIWNECVAKSKATHLHNKTTGGKWTCGPAQLDRMLTEARERTPWLRAGSSVPQQQLIRDFGRSRAKAHKDIRERLPQRQRAGMPKWKKKREALPTLNHTRRGFRLKSGRLPLAGGIVLTVVWSQDLPAEPSSVRVYQDSIGHWYCSFVVPVKVRPLPETGRKWAKKVVTDHDAIAVEDFRPKFLARSSMARKAADAAIGATKKALIQMGRKHGRNIRLVHPAHTTMDCASCGARTKHALPLSERTYTCTACGAVSPGDKNSARVMLHRAGLNPAGAEGARPPGAQLPEAA
ncbi:RNA-guided endonuclease InsQ/TnpB family protein [Streptomyces sp. NPDC059426]|uniref:RNA-guided endonuclease InsQ/TnpB family protein n=1 Tax=Streptomyces sp. NPDC059426 TaxID=3346827 RepID=UPI00369CAD4C